MRAPGHLLVKCPVIMSAYYHCALVEFALHDNAVITCEAQSYRQTYFDLRIEIAMT